MKKRITALLLALLMICSLLPLGAVAAQTPEDEQLAVIAGNALEDNTGAITATVEEAPETVHHVAKRAGSYSELVMAPTMENMAAVAGQKVVFYFCKLFKSHCLYLVSFPTQKGHFGVAFFFHFLQSRAFYKKHWLFCYCSISMLR